MDTNSSVGARRAHQCQIKPKSRLENRKFVDFFKRPRSPLTPLVKGELEFKVPLFKGDLGGSNLGYNQKFSA